MQQPLNVGDVLPYQPPRGINGDPLDKPVWYALMVRSTQEAKIRTLMTAEGIHTQYPVIRKTRYDRGKKIVTKRPAISGVVYSRFDYDPNWDVLRSRKMITGVFGYGDTPTPIPYDIIRQVMGLPTTIEALQQARLEMQRLRIGCRAQITRGPLAGFVVNIESLTNNVAAFSSKQYPNVRGTTDVSNLENLDAPPLFSVE